MKFKSLRLAGGFLIAFGLTCPGVSRAASGPGQVTQPAGGGPVISGELSTFGQGANFALGLGDTSNRTIPTRVGNSANWTEVSESVQHGVALQADGSLWAWGRNESGQLGTGDRTNRPAPVAVTSQTDWTAVATGRAHSLGLKADGSVWAWGVGQFGDLGQGDTNDRLVPTRVGTQNDWSSISAGYTRSFGIKSDGTLWGWGGNTNGSLGTGATSGRYTTPVQIGGSTSHWVQVSTANDGNHSAGIKSDGTLWTWGTGSSGQLGLGDTSDRSVPTQVGTANNWAMVDCGWNHTVAIKQDGTLWSWGLNDSGQLGTGDTKNRTSPFLVGTSSDWLKVSGGRHHTLAIKTDGTLWSWGNNSCGQLGTSGGNRSIPGQVGTLTDWKAIQAASGGGSTGNGNSAAIR
jgi:alpha-tubulin suppressor-like RCC1 family protein